MQIRHALSHAADWRITCPGSGPDKVAQRLEKDVFLFFFFFFLGTFCFAKHCGSKELAVNWAEKGVHMKTEIDGEDALIQG